MGRIWVEGVVAGGRMMRVGVWSQAVEVQKSQGRRVMARDLVVVCAWRL